jgi:hypothetical protein
MVCLVRVALTIMIIVGVLRFACRAICGIQQPLKAAPKGVLFYTVWMHKVGLVYSVLGKGVVPCGWVLGVSLILQPDGVIDQALMGAVVGLFKGATYR